MGLAAMSYYLTRVKMKSTSLSTQIVSDKQKRGIAVYSERVRDASIAGLTQSKRVSDNAPKP
jgi:hypothetical protein